MRRRKPVEREGLPTDIVATPTHVYWTVADSEMNVGDPKTRYSIWRTTRDLTLPTEQLARGQVGVTQLALAKGGLFWTRRDPAKPSDTTGWELVRLGL